MRRLWARNCPHNHNTELPFKATSLPLTPDPKGWLKQKNKGLPRTKAEEEGSVPCFVQVIPMDGMDVVIPYDGKIACDATNDNSCFNFYCES